MRSNPTDSPTYESGVRSGNRCCARRLPPIIMDELTTCERRRVRSWRHALRGRRFSRRVSLGVDIGRAHSDVPHIVSRQLSCGKSREFWIDSQHAALEGGHRVMINPNAVDHGRETSLLQKIFVLNATKSIVVAEAGATVPPPLAL